ncbi:RNA-binding protein [Mesorhizobium huakuii]|uniref:RNA-binding protein n=1 Tax=Mesorhizobium huakuii TaxID=28104 RepID=A0ABZ0VYU9_9HYPH|nr:RNA-binding protein [Mesorhizobium huakuii]WQC02607.1 RNA-binding protein [Mesorhizobium huakuii]
MPLAGCGGMFEPEDLDVLQRVFDRLCAERRLAQKDREQREVLAQDVICLFQVGVTDEDELWRALTKRSRMA